MTDDKQCSCALPPGVHAQGCHAVHDDNQLATSVTSRAAAIMNEAMRHAAVEAIKRGVRVNDGMVFRAFCELAAVRIANLELALASVAEVGAVPVALAYAASSLLLAREEEQTRQEDTPDWVSPRRAASERRFLELLAEKFASRPATAQPPAPPDQDPPQP